jgi:hypothetical protein
MQKLINNRLDLSVNQLASVGNSDGWLAGATYKPNWTAAHPAGRVRCALGPSGRWQGVGITSDFSLNAVFT